MQGNLPDGERNSNRGAHPWPRSLWPIFVRRHHCMAVLQHYTLQYNIDPCRAPLTRSNMQYFNMQSFTRVVRLRGRLCQGNVKFYLERSWPSINGEFPDDYRVSNDDAALSHMLGPSVFSEEAAIIWSSSLCLGQCVMPAGCKGPQSVSMSPDLTGVTVPVFPSRRLRDREAGSHYVR
jgi:hypothetical protein